MSLVAKNIFVHLILSVSFLMLPYVFIAGEVIRLPDVLHNPHDRFTLFVYFIMLCFFYFNFYYLLPKYYFQKQVVKYFGILLTILIFLIVFYWWVDYTPPHIFKPPPPHMHHGHPPPHMHMPKPAPMSQLSQILFLYIIGILVSLFVRVSRNLKNIESERNKTALAFLKSQINPHFLFNTFNSIYGLAVKEKADNTANGMLKLSGILRYVLTETQSDFVSLQKEMDYIQNYIDLQRLRIDAKTNLKYQVSGNASECVIAPLLMIPFIENAFKYGINPGIEAEISISISVHDEALELKVYNKKIVTRRDMDTQKQIGIGIENTKKRLALLYSQKYTLEMQESLNDFEVYLKLQLT